MPDMITASGNPPTSVAATATGASRVLSSARPRASWGSVALFAIVLTSTNVFWLTSLQGAVGVVDPSLKPFDRWLRDSTLMLPFFVLGIIAADAIARRIIRPHRPELLRVAAAGVLIFAIATGISIARVTTTAVQNYNIQVGQLEQIHTTHATTPAIPASPGGCTGLCSERHSTWLAQERAIGQASIFLTITNLVAVVWILALLGLRLAKPPRPRPANPAEHPSPAGEPSA